MAADQTSPGCIDCRAGGRRHNANGNPRRSGTSIVPTSAETFADSVSGLIFDGQSLRIEFAVTRLDEVKPNMPITGRRYPACRLVLPPAAAAELINRMQQIGAALAQAGVAKAAPRANETPPKD